MHFNLCLIKTGVSRVLLRLGLERHRAREAQEHTDPLYFFSFPKAQLHFDATIAFWVCVCVCSLNSCRKATFTPRNFFHFHPMFLSASPHHPCVTSLFHTLICTRRQRHKNDTLCRRAGGDVLRFPKQPLCVLETETSRGCRVSRWTWW